MAQNVFKAILLIQAGAQRANLLDKSEMLQGTTHDQRQLIGIHRFSKIVISAELHGLDRRLYCSESGQDDNDHFRVLRPDVLQQFDARRPGHLQISDDEVRRSKLEQRQRMLTRGRRSHQVSVLFQLDLQDSSQALVVIDYQDSTLRHGRLDLSGSEIRTVAPSGVLRAMVSIPPCCLMIW